MQRNRLSVALMLALVCASFVFVPLPAVVRAADPPLIVNTTIDPNPADGVCAPLGGGAGQSPDGCTLREAITLANTATVSATTTIQFDIEPSDPGYTIDFPYGPAISVETWTIKPIQPLPFITHDGVIVDGFSQAQSRGFNPNVFGPEIIIDGVDALPGTSAVTLQSSNNVIKGLGIINFNRGGATGYGIEIRPRGSNLSTGNKVQGCYIGVDKLGVSAAPNTVGVSVRTNNNVIGGDGTKSDEFNVVSGNIGDGLLIEGDGNKIQGNIIGLNANRQNAVPNGQNGVYVRIADNNLVGSPANAPNAIYRNLISGNTANGVLVSDGDGNQVSGNYIGTDVTGTKSIANKTNGVVITSSGGFARNNKVGDTGSFARNVISGNRQAGVRISGNNTLNNQVFNNYIGLSAGGLALTGAYSQTTGVLIETGADRNQVGGVGQGNVIAGNKGNGVQISGAVIGATTLSSNDNSVLSNVIGAGPTGLALPNKGDMVAGTAVITGSGVYVAVYASRTRVGGSGAGEGNVIVNHPQSGIVISGTNTVSSTIVGNLIGLLGRPGSPVASGNGCTTLAPNGGDGILLANGPQQTLIGGLTAASGNLIGGNVGNGIFVTNARFTTMQSNQIGTSQDGDRFYLCGNGKSGILIADALVSTITNTLVMNHANGDGIAIMGSNNNLLVGNRVFKNGNHGVRVGGSTTDTTILGSTIFTNTLNGISVESLGTQRVKMLDNRISANKQFGIELNPKTLEPTGDPNNPNHDINPPFAVQVDQTGRLTGRVLVDRTNSSTRAAACITCTIQLFSTAGDGQGRDKISEFKEVSANGYFTITVGRVPSQLALTATDGYSNTSEFAVFNASYALAIGPAYTRTAVPGQTINYSHRITNTGTVGFTDLKLGAFSSLKWAASVTPPAPITLAAGESKPVTLTLTLPTGAAPNVIAGSVDQTRVTVSSTAVTTATASVTNTTTVLPKFSLTVTPGNQALSVRPGIQAVYIHKVTNTGNLAGSVTLSAVTDRGGAWTTTLSPATFTLAPGASIDVSLRVTVPSGSVAGIKAITTLTVNVTSPTGITVPPIVDTTTVAETKQATIIPNREGQAAAGQTISFPHTVTNIGNTRVTYILTGTSSLGSVVKFRSDTPNIKLNADGSFTFEAPSDPNQNTNVFNFFIDITLDKRTISGQIDLVTITLLDEDKQPVGGASVQDTVRSVRSQLFVQSYLPLVAR